MTAGMSGPAGMKCRKCGQDTALRSWIQIFGSLDAALCHGDGPEFLTALLPGPGALKIEFCIACRSMEPCMDYTPEELKGLQEHAARAKERAGGSENLMKLLGGIFSPEKK